MKCNTKKKSLVRPRCSIERTKSLVVTPRCSIQWTMWFVRPRSNIERTKSVVRSRCHVNFNRCPLFVRRLRADVATQQFAALPLHPSRPGHVGRATPRGVEDHPRGARSPPTAARSPSRSVATGAGPSTGN